MYFIFGCAGSLLLCEFSLFSASWGYSVVLVHRLLVASAPLSRAQAPEHAGFRSCCSWARLWSQGSRTQAQYLWHTDLAVPQDVGSSWIRNQTRVSCIGRQILYHQATRAALSYIFKIHL